MAAIAVAVLLVDNLRTHRLRDVLTLGGLMATLTVTAAVSVLTASGQPLIGALVGAAAMFAFGLAHEFTRPGMLGFGTVKAAALVGAAAGGLGLHPWVSALGLMCAGYVALIKLAERRWTDMPTSPLLAAGLVGAVVSTLVVR